MKPFPSNKKNKSYKAEKELAHNKLLQEIIKSSFVHTLIIDNSNNEVLFNSSNFPFNANNENVTILDEEYQKTSDNKYYKCIKETINIGNNNYSKLTYIDSTRLVEYTYEKNNIDKKTGILNYEGFSNNLEQLVNKSSTKSCFFAMIDMDNFKALNDTYGHVKGDEILKSFAKLLKNSFRENDLIGRFGGDEFLVATNELSKENLCKRLSYIQNIVHDKLKKYNITLTVGISEYDNSLSYNNNKERVDLALYFGKKNGKNTLTIYEEYMSELNKNAPVLKQSPDENDMFNDCIYENER